MCDGGGEKMEKHIFRDFNQGGQYRTDTYTNIETPTFRTGLNIGHTGWFQALLVGTEKNLFFFFFLVL